MSSISALRKWPVARTAIGQEESTDLPFMKYKEKTLQLQKEEIYFVVPSIPQMLSVQCYLFPFKKQNILLKSNILLSDICSVQQKLFDFCTQHNQIYSPRYFNYTLMLFLCVKDYYEQHNISIIILITIFIS